MADLSVTVRQRARFLLTKADADGRLETTLCKLDAFCDATEVKEKVHDAEAAPAAEAASAAEAAPVVQVTPPAEAAPAANEEHYDEKHKKLDHGKRDRGRGLDAALRVATAHAKAEAAEEGAARPTSTDSKAEEAAKPSPHGKGVVDEHGPAHGHKRASVMCRALNVPVTRRASQIVLHADDLDGEFQEWLLFEGRMPSNGDIVKPLDGETIQRIDVDGGQWLVPSGEFATVVEVFKDKTMRLANGEGMQSMHTFPINDFCYLKKTFERSKSIDPALKFAEARRQEQAREKAKELYRERSMYIDAKLRVLLEVLVGGVSAPEKRPENPVPMMIEILAEQCGKAPSSFKTGPANRLKREIKELEKECTAMEDELGLESESDSSGFGED